MGTGDVVRINLTAKIIGRTFEEDPKVDLQTPWGVLNSVRLSALSAMEVPEEQDEAGEDASELIVEAPAENVRSVPKGQGRRVLAFQRPS